MPENISYEREGILKFASPNFSPGVAVFVLESREILPDVRKLFPAAKIAFMSVEGDSGTRELCKKLKIDFMRGNYFAGDLPTQAKCFDIIFARDCLTLAPDFYSVLLEINHLLKDSGYMITQFFNVRFLGVLENLSSLRDFLVCIFCGIKI